MSRDPFDNFDRNAKVGIGAFIFLWVISFAVTLGFLGLLAWAIIKLVNHYAS